MDEKTLIAGLMSFKFDGQERIDVELLMSSLNGFVQAYKAYLGAAYQEPTSDIEINVRAFAPGSFDVVLESIVPVLPAVAPYVPQALECGKTFLEMIKLKKELKGKKALNVEPEGDRVKIVNQDGDTHYHDSTVYNYYFNNPTIDVGLSNMFSSLKGSSRPAVSFSSSDQSVQVESESYEAMSLQVIDELDSANLHTMSNIVYEQLLLKRPDLLGDSKWDFYYSGKAIHASIEDKPFLQAVKQGKIKQLYAGVRLPVEMRIDAYLNERLEVERTIYTIQKVTGTIIEPSSDTDQFVIEDITE